MTDFLDKINRLDRELQLPEVHQQVNELKLIVNCIKQRQVLKNAPQPLGFYPDELEKLQNGLKPQARGDLTVLNHLLNGLRQYLSINYGIWSVPNLTTAKLIKDQFQITSALEIMAGNAYWSKAFAEVGIKTVATDSLEWARTSKTGGKPFFKLANKTAVSAIKQFTGVDLIFCSWAPNFDQSDLLAIKAWRKYHPACHLLFVGEQNGATNSPAFWHQARFCHSKELTIINRSFSSFDFIKEQIFEIKHEN